MKKILYFILFFELFSFVTNAYALSPTDTPTPTITVISVTPTSEVTGIINEINNLKDRIASRVAQLNLVEKRGIIGTVTDIGQTQITLSDKDQNTRFVDVDELTKFSSPSAKDSFGISDITKGSIVGVLGRYNKDSKRILARFLNVLVLPQVISGTVTNIDTDNYLLTITTPDQKQIIADISTLTKTSVYSKDTGIVKSGFSKINSGERVIVVGFQDQQNSNKVLASRIIRLPEIKSNPKIHLLKPTENGVTPSTGSGLKLVPINNKK